MNASAHASRHRAAHACAAACPGLSASAMMVMHSMPIRTGNLVMAPADVAAHTGPSRITAPRVRPQRPRRWRVLPARLVGGEPDDAGLTEHLALDLRGVLGDEGAVIRSTHWSSGPSSGRPPR